MKTLIVLLLLATSHLLPLAYADNTEDFIKMLKTTQVNGIDTALIRLDLFSIQENKQLASNKTQLKFIYTDNKLELSTFIKKEKPKMTINECLRYLKRIKEDYNNAKLSRIAFTNYSPSDQKIAEKLFAYQVLLVDQAEPDMVMTCR